MENVATGLLRGTGAAINVELGWIPDYVRVVNSTDGTKIHEGWPGNYETPFTSGGTTEVKKGNTLTGNTSGAVGSVAGVILDTGTWAGGDAAGWIIFDPASITGTFSAGETAKLTGGTDDITLTAALIAPCTDTDTEVAAATGNASITPYVGVAGSNSLGFTVGLTISTDAKALSFFALRAGPGNSGRKAYNSA